MQMAKRWKKNYENKNHLIETKNISIWKAAIGWATILKEHKKSGINDIIGKEKTCCSGQAGSQ